MRKVFYSLILFVCLATAASGQMNLALSEIGQIQALDSIVSLNAIDLQGDSLKELIISCMNNIYVYDSQSHDLLWTSPWFFRPRDLMIYDIDQDGHSDIALRDSLNVFIFSGLDFRLLWTSPTLDSTFACYAIGDQNSDGHLDLLLAKKELFTRRYNVNNRDTLWIRSFNGPDFQSNEEFIVLLRNYQVSSGGSLNSLFESPIKIVIDCLSGENGIQNRILLFTSVTINSTGPQGYYRNLTSGAAYIIQPGIFNYTEVANIGQYLSSYHIYQDSIEILYMVSNFSLGWGYYPYYEYSRAKYIQVISADTVISSSAIWNISDNDNWPSDWGGFLEGEIIQNNGCDEFSYAANGTLNLYTFPAMDSQWSIAGISPSANIFGLYHNSRLFSNPQIMYGMLDKLYDGATGNLNATITNPGVILKGVVDIDSDDEDEVFLIDHHNLQICHLDSTATGIDPSSGALPYVFRLYFNYPNPFNAQTMIEYSLTKASPVVLEIFDLLGRKTATLSDGVQETGHHHLNWNAEGQPSGIYFYKIKTNNYSETKKMLLLR